MATNSHPLQVVRASACIHIAYARRLFSCTSGNVNTSACFSICFRYYLIGLLVLQYIICPLVFSGSIFCVSTDFIITRTLHVLYLLHYASPGTKPERP